jgi:2-polyprenyl-3-methyl-5-hydroxy-6-metoxy-1,4-benzoquinol methylase
MNITKIKKYIKSNFWSRILIYFPYLAARRTGKLFLLLVITVLIFIPFLIYGFLVRVYHFIISLKPIAKNRINQNISSFELASCNLCSSKEFRSYLEKDNWKLVKCRECGLIFLNPRPTWETIKRMYGPNQYNYLVGGKKYVNAEKEMVEKYLVTVKTIEKFKRKGKILEIGSATGYFLKAAKMRGWKVYGVEICKDGVEYAKREFKIGTSLGTLEEVNFPSNFFDVIVMYHTLEHLTDPLTVLKEVKRILKNDGLVNISVPNVSCWERILQGKKWGTFELPSHLYCFSPLTLQKLLQKAGFKIIKGKGGGEINVFLKKSDPSSPLIPFWVKCTIEGYFPLFQINNWLKICKIIVNNIKTQS